jgi:methylmalonyl-CoA mutase cobalamin-binding domain/chain
MIRVEGRVIFADTGRAGNPLGLENGRIEMKTDSGRAKFPRKKVHEKVRVLTVVPICDGHDSPIITINLELARHGVEVVYLGYHRSVRDIVRAAIQEDVRAIGISSYNGGHIEFFDEVLRLLRKNGARNIAVFGGGGGTITPQDAKLMKRRGVDEIFFAGTPLDAIVQFVKKNYGAAPGRKVARKFRPNSDDLQLSRMLNLAQNGARFSTPVRKPSSRTIGVTGPGGVGKTTLIDELTLRFLTARPQGRLAILSHDPSLVGKGAVLGDRATMVYAQNDRVFMRSLATNGKSGGVANETRACVDIFKAAQFDMIIVESAGIGQEDQPFSRGFVDKQVLVMSPEYGGRLQLQKIAMLETADVVVLNKKDLPGARTAISEIEHRLGFNERAQKLITTTAKVHLDPGVDQLFTLLNL